MIAKLAAAGRTSVSLNSDVPTENDEWRSFWEQLQVAPHVWEPQHFIARYSALRRPDLMVFSHNCIGAHKVKSLRQQIAASQLYRKSEDEQHLNANIEIHSHAPTTLRQNRGDKETIEIPQSCEVAFTFVGTGMGESRCSSAVLLALGRHLMVSGGKGYAGGAPEKVMRRC